MIILLMRGALYLMNNFVGEKNWSSHIFLKYAFPKLDVYVQFHAQHMQVKLFKMSRKFLETQFSNTGVWNPARQC